jgi:hypothetical protein
MSTSQLFCEDLAAVDAEVRAGFANSGVLISVGDVSPANQQTTVWPFSTAQVKW